MINALYLPKWKKLYRKISKEQIKTMEQVYQPALLSLSANLSLDTVAVFPLSDCGFLFFNEAGHVSHSLGKDQSGHYRHPGNIFFCQRQLGCEPAAELTNPLKAEMEDAKMDGIYWVGPAPTFNS